MKRLMIATTIAFTLLLSACSNTEGNLGFLNALANFKTVTDQDEQINQLFQKYKPLLNAVEVKQAEDAYKSIKAASKKPSLETPLDYLKAKAAYVKVIPLYSKYKAKIEPADQVTITEIHAKLKGISTAIDEAIQSNVKNELTIEYIKTATLLIGAFS